MRKEIVALFLGILPLFVIAQACGSSSSTSSPPSGAGGAGGTGTAGQAGFSYECQGALCDSAAQACKASLPLCPIDKAYYEADPVGTLGACTKAIVEVLGKSDGGTSAAQAKISCLTAAASCPDVELCNGKKPCSGEDCPSDAGKVDAIAPNDAAPDAGYLLDDDTWKCVQCALDHCLTESKYCFVDSSMTAACKQDAGNVDCCIDYRACLQACAHGFPTDPSGLAKCGASCGTEFPKGKAQFDPYQVCMQAACATCGN